MQYLPNGFSLSLHNVRYSVNIPNLASFSIVFYGLDKALVSLIRRDCATSHNSSYVGGVTPTPQSKRCSSVALRNFYICDTLDS